MARIETFDPNAYESTGGEFGMIPAGTYKLQLTDSDVKRNRKDNGDDIACVFEITEGPFKGRKLFHDFKYTHPNETAQKIGREEFSCFIKATGYAGPLDDTNKLHWKPVLATVEAWPEGSVDKDYTFSKDTNKIRGKSFKPAAGASGNAPTGASPQPSAAATPASPSSPPWARNQAA